MSVIDELTKQIIEVYTAFYLSRVIIDKETGSADVSYFWSLDSAEKLFYTLRDELQRELVKQRDREAEIQNFLKGGK